ncbi:MAG: YraN family protein [Elusimicrobiaceae bacterium]|nr:YraN family protein [Elusimicrobiaceae bacterium]
MIDNTHGAQAETLAANYLQQKGYKILARNYRKNCGEIDIIALDGKTLVFAEVKSRTSSAFGGPLAAITKSKQNKISATALCYIKENAPKFDSIRFDAICLLNGEMTHLPNAFFPPRGNL